ncbi:pyridoxal phosphate-dependent aminotransferase [Secundilactobacillus kimchicus]|uniref:pyridoxal phosphate-dependent aminotransferase n=1 Tax=Secundilactobacillus kimchicus TaxID=528209 RepID=UPI0024A949A8|nr:pyridoxal phosphate-dependent aminotransferase [Secundilactobacillus kimchicus]
MQLSNRISQIQPSATLKVSGKAKQMIANGIDVINLGIGEPDFQTPDNIKQAAIAAIQTGKASFYTPAAGLPRLREAIANVTATDYGISVDQTNVAVTTGAKMALYGTFQAILNPGDGVLLPEPYWVSYAEQIKLAGGVPMGMPVTDGFKVTPELLEQALTAQVKVLLLNSPENPTGVIYEPAELQAIADWAEQHQIWVITDDIYGKLTYNGAKFTSIAALKDQLPTNMIIINGVSKTYSMTGWRIGYVVANSELIKALSAFLSHATGNPAAASQYAALEALTGLQDDAEMMRHAFEQRLNTLYPLLNAIPGFSLATKPQGAFYLFPDVADAQALTGIATTGEFVDQLLTEAHVAVVDGNAFGVDHHVRLSYATDLETLKNAVSRITEFMKAHTK